MELIEQPAHTPGGTDIATGSHTRSDLEAGFASWATMGRSHIEIAPSPHILEMSLEEQASSHLRIESFLEKHTAEAVIRVVIEMSRLRSKKNSVCVPQGSDPPMTDRIYIGFLFDKHLSNISSTKILCLVGFL